MENLNTVADFLVDVYKKRGKHLMGKTYGTSNWQTWVYDVAEKDKFKIPLFAKKAMEASLDQSNDGIMERAVLLNFLKQMSVDHKIQAVTSGATIDQVLSLFGRDWVDLDTAKRIIGEYVSDRKKCPDPVSWIQGDRPDGNVPMGTDEFDHQSIFLTFCLFNNMCGPNGEYRDSILEEIDVEDFGKQQDENPDPKVIQTLHRFKVPKLVKLYIQRFKSSSSSSACASPPDSSSSSTTSTSTRKRKPVVAGVFIYNRKKHRVVPKEPVIVIQLFKNGNVWLQEGDRTSYRVISQRKYNKLVPEKLQDLSGGPVDVCSLNCDLSDPEDPMRPLYNVLEDLKDYNADLHHPVDWTYIHVEF